LHKILILNRFPRSQHPCYAEHGITPFFR
jgi:hypothetical protein